MKNIFGAIIIAFTLSNCNQKSNNIATSEETVAVDIKPVFTVDSIKVEDSITLNKNLTTLFSSTVLVFPTLTDKTLLDSIYSQEKFNLSSYDKTELSKVLNQKKQEYFEESKESLKEYTPDFEQTWNRSSSMKVFSNKNNILTLSYTGDGYSGGAHGYYYELYKNFNLKTNQAYQVADVFSTTDAKVWEPILFRNFLKDNEEDLLFEKEIPLNNNFYFDASTITFVYNQYEIGPYAAGVIYIKMPFSEISQHLNPKFKSEMNIK